MDPRGDADQTPSWIWQLCPGARLQEEEAGRMFSVHQQCSLVTSNFLCVCLLLFSSSPGFHFPLLCASFPSRAYALFHVLLPHHFVPASLLALPPSSLELPQIHIFSFSSYLTVSACWSVCRFHTCLASPHNPKSQFVEINPPSHLPLHIYTAHGPDFFSLCCQSKVF